MKNIKVIALAIVFLIINANATNNNVAPIISYLFSDTASSSNTSSSTI